MLNQNRKYVLPHSGRRYSVDSRGEVLDKDGNAIPVRLVSGHKTITLEWLFGKGDYLVGTLVLLANGHFRDFPEYLLNEVEPLYKDDDPSNTLLGNLTYRFKKGPLEVEGFPGYCYIPFYTRYAISREGEMITAATGVVNNHLGVKRIWSTLPPNEKKGSPGGYRYLRAVTDNGESRILFRHQALCWTYKPYQANVRDLVCNHLDGVPGNDSLDNLELTTYSENNSHAIRLGLRKGMSSIVALNLKTGERHEFRTASECLKVSTELTRAMVVHRLTDPVAKQRIHSDFWVFRRKNDSTPFPEYVEGVTEIYRASYDRDVVARDIHDGHLIVASSYNQLGKTLGLSPTAIRNRVAQDDPRPFKGYCFKHLDDKRGWPSFTERQLQIHLKYRHKDRTPNGVIVNDLTAKDELFFCSREEAAEYFNISPSTVYDLAVNSKVFRQRYRFNTFDVHSDVLWSHWPETVSCKPL